MDSLETGIYLTSQPVDGWYLVLRQVTLKSILQKWAM